VELGIGVVPNVAARAGGDRGASSQISGEALGELSGVEELEKMILKDRPLSASTACFPSSTKKWGRPFRAKAAIFRQRGESSATKMQGVLLVFLFSKAGNTGVWRPAAEELIFLSPFRQIVKDRFHKFYENKL
jgi:hypothetical protein